MAFHVTVARALRLQSLRVCAWRGGDFFLTGVRAVPPDLILMLSTQGDEVERVAFAINGATLPSLAGRFFIPASCVAHPPAPLAPP